MSKSVSIRYREQSVWALDVVVSIFLKHLVEVASQHPLANEPWMEKLIHLWRVQTTLADCFGVTLDDAWSDAQVSTVIGLIEETCGILEKRESISAEEIENWALLNGTRIFARRMPLVRTLPVLNLARAMVSMLRGTLPLSPPGTWWWYGVEDYPETIPRKS